MKRKVLFTGIVCLGIAVLLSGFQEGTESDGAPPSATGAPGENNCTMSGCHDDNPVNSGPATFDISFSDKSLEYEPGKTYSITVTIQEGNKKVFGFENIAISDGTNTQVGSVIITDSLRTQILDGYGTFADRSYTTYTYEGSYTSTSGSSTWSFDWKAPSMEMGPITFYTAFLAGNDDHTDGGDLAYLKQLKINPASTGVFDQHPLKLEIYPNPVMIGNQVNISTGKKIDSQLILIDINGKKVMEKTLPSSRTHVTTQDLQSGIYFLTVVTEGEKMTKKLVIQ